MKAQAAIVILGPTASGKSDVAIRLAERLGAEVISADSMQVYRGMDIGTAKPPREDLERVRHHLIDVCEPDEPMTVARYCALAMKAYEDITGRGKPAIVAGGTGLYIDALTRGFLFPDTDADHELRQQLYLKAAEDGGTEALHGELAEADPVSASRIHRNDARRIVRALEVLKKTGRPISELQAEAPEASGIPAVFYGLKADRKIIVGRIERRVDEMLSKGLLKEVEGLIGLGYGNCRVAMQAIGYKELIAHLEGSMSLDEAVARIKAETRKYSKRQMTWFKRNSKTRWFDSGTMDADAIAGCISSDLIERGLLENGSFRQDS